MARILETTSLVDKKRLVGPWQINCFSCESLIEFLISDKDQQGCYVCPACGHAWSALDVELDEWVVRC